MEMFFLMIFREGFLILGFSTLNPQAPVAQKSADQSRLIVFLLSLVIRISDETADSQQYVDIKTN